MSQTVWSSSYRFGLLKLMANVKEIEGIGTVFGAKLEEFGVSTEAKLLEEAATRAGRHRLSESTGISETLILKWVNRADLARIKGIGSEFADLMEASGVDTVPELAQRNASNLAEKLAEVSMLKALVKRIPSEGEVEEWISQAKSLDRVVTY